MSFNASLDNNMHWSVFSSNWWKLWRHRPESRHSCLEHGGQRGHVDDPIGLEAILGVDVVEVFENLGCS